MASEIRVNTINNRSGLGTISINDSGASFSGVVTATSFTGNLTGNVTSSSTSTFTNGLNVTGGNVGIGTDNPSTSLHLLGPNTAARGQLSVAGSAGAGARVSLYQGSTFIGHISGDTTNGIFHSTESTYPIIFAPSGSEKARVTSGGNVQIANGNLVFSTAGTGIDFSANSNAGGATSELLDDYEEGTWTPQVTQGVTSPTYTIQGGGYVKIGSLVYASFDIIMSGGTPNSSQLRFGNFPFSAAASAKLTFGAGVISYGSMLDRSTLQNLNLHMSWNGVTYIEVFNGTTAVNGNSSGANLGSGNRIIATISYRTDS